MQVTFAGASRSEQRRFCCRACGHSAMVEVIGLGEGAQSFLNPRGTAQRRAERDAVKDVDRTLSVATCPRCGHRDPGAVRRWWALALMPHAIGFVVVAAAGWIPLVFGMNMREGDKWLAGWIMTGIACLVALVMLPSVFIKWSVVKQGVRFSPAPGSERQG